MNQSEEDNQISLATGGQNHQPRMTFEVYPGVVWIFDVQRSEGVYVSSKLSQVLGYEPLDFQSFPDHWLSIVLDEDRELFEQYMHRTRSLVSEQESESIVARFNHKDGGCKYLKVTGTVLDGHNSTVTRLIYFFQDITDQVRAEEDAQATRELFDETEKLILFGSWSWNARNGKITWTEGMYHLLEYEPGEIGEVNRDFFTRHILPEYLETLEAIVMSAIAAQSDFETECIIRTKTGREKFVSSKGKPILDKDGALRQYVGTTRDITTKKNAEKDRDRRIRELNRSNKELEEFAYVASHDMHEPLRKILTFGEKINNKYANALGDEGRVYLDRMISSAQSMRNLIDNLLEFSRVSRGTRAFVPTDLNEIIRQVASDQELRIEETGTQLKVRELPVIEAVQTELRQLFNNLISNAIKFRKKDVTPVITISSHKLTHKEKSEYLIPFNQSYYRISIQDNGIGFEAVYSEKIFEIFQRLNGKSEYSGSGIGLAICKKIVENHDGLIHATGELGVGSSFSIILPEIQYH